MIDRQPRAGRWTTRRTVLRAGVLGGVLLAMGGLGLALQPGVMRAPRSPSKALSPRAFAVLASFADRVCPGGRGLPPAWELFVPEKVDLAIDRLDPLTATELGRALLLLENGLVGLLLDGRPRPFTTLDPAGQDQVIEAWRTSRLEVRRLAVKGLQGLVSAAYWSDPATFRFVGYPGPPRFPDVP